MVAVGEPAAGTIINKKITTIISNKLLSLNIFL